MSQLLQLTLFEMRLLLRSKTFWLIGMLSVISAVSPTLSVLLLQFAVIGTITRDERSGFSPLLTALPYNTVNLVMARALAVFCLLLGLCPLMIAAASFLADMELAEWLLDGRQVGLLIISYLTFCVAAIGFVSLAGLITRQAWKLYMAVGTCWIVWTAITSNLSYFPSWTTLFVLGYGEMRPVAPSVTAGYFPRQALLPWFAAFQLALATGMLLIAAARRMAKRGERASQSKPLIALAVMAISVFCTVGFVVWQELDNREAGFRLGLKEELRQESVVAEPGIEADPQLEDYQLNIKLQTATHRIAGQATIKMRLQDPSNEICWFTLRNYFTVEDIVDGKNGEKLEWRREGSRLAVRLPDNSRREESLTMIISYSGKVWEWFPGRLARPSGEVNFVADSFSLLRSGYAWYPVPGNHPLYTSRTYINPWNERQEETLWAKRVGHPAVPFALTVDIDNDSTVVTNLDHIEKETLVGEYKQRYHFRSPSGRDVFLITGPYDRERRSIPGRSEFVEVYSYHQHRGNIDKVLDLLVEPYHFFEGLFQSERFNMNSDLAAKKYTVVEVPSSLFLTADGTSIKDLALTDTILLSENYFRSKQRRFAVLADIQSFKCDYAVLQRWLQEDMTCDGARHNGSISEGLMLYLLSIFEEEKRGTVFYEQIKQNLLTAKSTDDGQDQFILPSLTGGPIVRDVFMILDAIRTSEWGGDPALKSIVHNLYQVYVRKRAIESTDFTEAVEALMVQQRCPQDEAEDIRQRLENISKNMNDQEYYMLKPTVGVTIMAFCPEEWAP